MFNTSQSLSRCQGTPSHIEVQFCFHKLWNKKCFVLTGLLPPWHHPVVGCPTANSENPPLHVHTWWCTKIHTWVRMCMHIHYTHKFYYSSHSTYLLCSNSHLAYIWELLLRYPVFYRNSHTAESETSSLVRKHGTRKQINNSTSYLQQGHGIRQEGSIGPGRKKRKKEVLVTQKQFSFS